MYKGHLSTNCQSVWKNTYLIRGLDTDRWKDQIIQTNLQCFALIRKVIAMKDGSKRFFLGQHMHLDPLQFLPLLKVIIQKLPVEVSPVEQDTIDCVYTAILYRARTSAAKPYPFFRVEPNFGPKIRVESGRVGPKGRKTGPIGSGWLQIGFKFGFNPIMYFMAFPVVEFSREGYKIRKVFG